MQAASRAIPQHQGIAFHVDVACFSLRHGARNRAHRVCIRPGTAPPPPSPSPRNAQSTSARRSSRWSAATSARSASGLQGRGSLDANEARRRAEASRVPRVADSRRGSPDISNVGESGTRAKAEIWSKRGDFDKAIADFVKHSQGPGASSGDRSLWRPMHSSQQLAPSRRTARTATTPSAASDESAAAWPAAAASNTTRSRSGSTPSLEEEHGAHDPPDRAPTLKRLS